MMEGHNETHLKNYKKDKKGRVEERGIRKSNGWENMIQEPPHFVKNNIC
jgi:hypothetical protein